MKSKGTTFNLSSEQHVLGSMIVSRKVLIQALGLLTEDSFYDKKSHAVIFKALQSLEDQGKPIDIEALTTELGNNMKMLDQVGGVSYLSELRDIYVGDKNAIYHVQVVNDLYLVRKLLNKSKELEKRFLEEKITDVSDYLDDYYNEIFAITKNRSTGGFQETSDVLKRLSKQIQKRRASGKRSSVIGVDTGYGLLNHYTGGWQNGNLIILAARPSVGKTAFAINLMYNAALKAKKSVAFFSLEMSAEDICTRLLAQASNINSKQLKTGNLTDSDWMAIQETENQLSSLKIYIDDTSGIKVGEIKSKVNKLKAQDPNLGLVVIDYLGLVNVSNPNLENRLKIGEISHTLKAMAKDLDIPVICLSQLSRANEKSGRKPILSDLRDSGDIEQDADIVIMLHRENYQKQGKDKPKAESQVQPDQDTIVSSTEVTDIIVAKNRNGETGTIQLSFVMNIGKFVEISREFD